MRVPDAVRTTTSLMLECLASERFSNAIRNDLVRWRLPPATRTLPADT
jgi:hypothetical protein